jgi:transcription initiation factor TFIIIB Brf1 subunit/transcription initiation factor TFIIB
MKAHEIIVTQDLLARICPFCHNKLGAVEYAKHKTLKICKCKKCGCVIDERIIKY